jgi:hypothetical protein
MGYSIWLEFEEYVNYTGTDEDGFCNIAVTYDDGRHQGFNVWTVEFFREDISRILEEAEEQGYATLPDFIVTELTREHITEVLKQILPP